ncbi:DUF4440 domain-containing protein [Pseudokineococcus lusitanus]|uniref:DUF4440 domain-containing protein n=1 Tax=Pseudokineococcus lusitanus TaxID=763993 RepID=A0A3N1HJN1_9ACTN|nr:DUF4440 domain-containing protein [Pseudokineococcus lusitanus]ROP42748.1 hypothetical protein EDC03_2033 [Pseudokineococcus lusitanus]
MTPCRHVLDPAAPDVGPADLDDVVARELALLDPAVRRSRARLEQLLDERFTEVGASGRTYDRGAVVALLLDEGATAAVPVADVEAAAVAPGAVLVTYLSDPAHRPARRSSLWRRGPDGWRLRHHQGTSVPGPDV